MKRKLLFSIVSFVFTLNAFSQIAPGPVTKTLPPAKDTADRELVFTKVEQEASFPGGNKSWSEYLVKKLGSFEPAKNGAPKGKYQVVVKFIVDKKGKISNAVAETKHGYGMEQAVVKMIKESPDWVPAFQNGRAVNAYRRQPVSFVVE